MSVAGIAAQEIGAPLKSGFLHNGQALGTLESCWGPRSDFNSFLGLDPITMACRLNSAAPEHLPGLGRAPKAARLRGSLPPLTIPASEDPGPWEEERLAGGLKRLSLSTPPLTPSRASPAPFPGTALGERGSRPLPPLPISEDLSGDEADSEVQFLTSSDTALLLGHCALPDFQADLPGRRSFRGCGQINYAYLDTPAASATDLDRAPEAAAAASPAPLQARRRLRRSHSGPAGSFSKPAAGRAHAHCASPNSDDDKPEVPPRVPIPPRPAKPDYRRWSAEVTSSTYSDEDKPPKVPPREPLSRSNSRTPSPKSLPSYLNGVMPPTQSFAPDPKYVSSKALQRQHSEGAAGKAPCILPIMENGRKVSSTHYYLLPERPPYLCRYQHFLCEAEEPGARLPAPPAERPDPKARLELGSPGKRKHGAYVVSP
ncbi:ERBB receptor feedback inhibitor 1 [Sorex araneus]|uniref:ERBB receptor feedback inhibitor 1 n=1 Tax=Sorex araneus TaxID=42254 RepID=UPI00243362EB|nr:ERBB receptor feedback inhibitor 1 [Sorex araneus]XP_054993554.1 ERBB receptor feedback inhibitor 1 [Sorex araneus]XP_054993555.1 ERBB receptor feedback inhibitor 1 [Sorex araneus]